MKKLPQTDRVLNDYLLKEISFRDHDLHLEGIEIVGM